MTMEKVMEKTMEIQDKKQGKNKQTKQLALWIGALILGAILGALGIEVLSGTSELPQNLEQTSYYDHILGVIPNNIIKPFAEGNVLSILLLAAAAGIALAKMPQSNKKEVVVKGLLGLQDLLFMLIRGLIWALPLGIVAFAAQLSAQFSAGIVMDSLGKYVAIILAKMPQSNKKIHWASMLPSSWVAMSSSSSSSCLCSYWQGASILCVH